MDALEPALSSARLGPYLVASGFDAGRALRLYLWNARMGAAFHVPIQAVEVGLRNRSDVALTRAFGTDWWREPQCLDVLDEERRADLALVLRRMKHRGLPEVTGQVVAGLSFGFWVGLLQGRYNPPLWGSQVRSAFPSLPPDRGRKSLASAAARVVHLRNRIGHHEPIFKLDLNAEFATVMSLLGWISPTKQDWVRPHCDVPSLLREKP